MTLAERLGKYSIQEVLGKGAMGVVYKAFDPHIRRTVALKVIRKEFLEDDEAATLMARFKNEAQAAGRLSHPGIVAVYEYGERIPSPISRWSMCRVRACVSIFSAAPVSG